MGMEEISLSGEGPGSAGPLYYSDMSPLKAVKLMTRGELREETGRDEEALDGEDGRGWTEKPSKSKGVQSGKLTLVCVDGCFAMSAPFGHLHQIDPRKIIMGLKILARRCPRW